MDRDREYAIFKKKLGDFNLFPVGSRVSVARECVDFSFFKADGTETGTVIKNKKDYLGIIVEFDTTYYCRYKGVELKTFNFNPRDLKIIKPGKLNYCPNCGVKLPEIK